MFVPVLVESGAGVRCVSACISWERIEASPALGLDRARTQMTVAAEQESRCTKGLHELLHGTEDATVRQHRANERHLIQVVRLEQRSRRWAALRPAIVI